MRGPQSRSEGKQNRVRRRRPRSDRGVAPILGALLVLVIVLTAFALVMTQALPVWMAQDETSLGRGVEGSLASLQASVDLQSAFGAPAVVYQPIPLSSGSVPVLAAPTIGSAAFAPAGPTGYANVTWSATSGGGAGSENVSFGELWVELPNRYIPSSTFAFEGGAVISESGNGPPTIASPPPFAVGASGGNRTVELTLVSMTGPPQSIGGAGSHEIVDQLRAVQDLSRSEAAGFTVTWTIQSSFACAWAAWALPALADSGLPSTAYSVQGPTGCAAGGGASGTLVVSISGVTWLSVDRLTVALSLSAAGGGA